MENISSLFQGDSQRLDPRAEQGEQPWEMIMDKKHFKLWRRPIEGTHLYQYRGNAGGMIPSCPSPQLLMPFGGVLLKEIPFPSNPGIKTFLFLQCSAPTRMSLPGSSSTCR